MVFTSEILNRFFHTIEQYKIKFGADSLENVNFCTPHYIGDNDYTEDIIKDLEKAIKNNKPFPKFIPPEGMNIIY